VGIKCLAKFRDYRCPAVRDVLAGMEKWSVAAGVRFREGECSASENAENQIPVESERRISSLILS
jgi:hypothetical protein